jgi:hypothetical protein
VIKLLQFGLKILVLTAIDFALNAIKNNHGLSKDGGEEKNEKTCL